MFLRFTQFIEHCSKSRYFLLYLFVLALIVRCATFFVEYFYPDMIVSYLYRNGLNGGWPAQIHKGVVYTWFLDLSFWLFGWSAASLHIMAFFITFIEGCLVYTLASVLKYTKITAYMAAFLFILVSSTALPEIMVPNGEQVFTIFFLTGFICFAKAYFDRCYIYYVGVIISLILAVKSKETGVWLPLTILFCLYVDMMKNILKTRKKVLLAVFIACLLGFICICILFLLAVHYRIESLQWLYNAWNYILMYPKFNLVKWIAVLFLPFCHPFYFLFPVANLRAQFQGNDFKRREIFLYGVILCLFLSAFAGGTRLYQHYFFPLYPILAIFCSNYIVKYADKQGLFFKKIGGVSLIHIGVLFFLYIYWALMVNVFKDFYFKSSELTPNSYSVYLYPNKMERETIQFLQKEKEKNSNLEIYIWPIGHVMGYFSKLPFKIGPYIDVEDNACLLYNPVEFCAKYRVDSFFKLNKSGDIFVEYRGILDESTFSSNPLKAFFQKGFSSHQNLFSKTEAFAKAIDAEMKERGAKRIFNVRNSLYLWKKP